MHGLWGDIKLAARMLAKRPGFTAVGVLTLALGIGANSAIFSVVNSLLFQPLPVPEAGRLVALTAQEQGVGYPGGHSYPNFLDYAKLPVFDAASAFTPSFLSLSAPGMSAVRIIPQVVGPGFFEMLGLQAEHGRVFLAQDVAGEGASQFVLSHATWQRLFAGDPGIVGQTVRINDHPFTVVGITPESFHGTVGLLEVDGYLPLEALRTIDPTLDATLEDRGQNAFRVIARLAPGVNLEAARAAVTVRAARLADEYPETNKRQTGLVHPEPMARMETAAVAFMPPIAGVFMGLVGLVLLIACANVANLMLVRGMAREKEMAIRLSLGAGRGQVLRQLLVESLMLSALGAGAALLIAQWATSALGGFSMASDLPIRLDFSLDRNVLLFTLGVAVLTGVLTGLLPGLRAGRADLVDSLKEGGRSTGAGSGRHLLRNALVVAQICISVALLVCAGLFVRTARNATDIDLGFEIDHRLTLTWDGGLLNYDDERQMAFQRALLERVRGLPGVVSAAVSHFLPVGYMNEGGRLAVEGQVESASEPTRVTLLNSVSPGYFRTMGTELREGRDFTDDDRPEAPRVAIVNQALADAYWPGQPSLGKRISVEGPGGPFLEVVGVAETSKYTLPAEAPIPMVYRPFPQAMRSMQVLFVHTEGEPLAILPAVRAQIQALDPAMPVFDVRSLRTHIEEGKLRMFAVAASLVGTFGLIGAFLAAIGLYGVTAFSVGQRRHEIGVRMALGATPGQILAMVLRQGAVLSTIGVGLGLLLASGLARSFANLLVGVDPVDPLTYGGVALLLVAVTLAACAVPARQAAAGDPLAALHCE